MKQNRQNLGVHIFLCNVKRHPLSAEVSLTRVEHTIQMIVFSKQDLTRPLILGHELANLCNIVSHLCMLRIAQSADA